MSTPVVHELKTVDPYFRDVAEGRKTFELRLNDRCFSVGDVLHLRQYENGARSYSGLDVRVRVTSLLVGPTLGVKAGWVVMSIARVATEEATP